jgi:hypothetical protein
LERRDDRTVLWPIKVEIENVPKFLTREAPLTHSRIRSGVADSPYQAIAAARLVITGREGRHIGCPSADPFLGRASPAVSGFR